MSALTDRHAGFFKIRKGKRMKAKAQKKTPQEILSSVTMSDEERAERILKLWKKTKRFKATYEELDRLLASADFGLLAQVKLGRKVYQLEIESPFEKSNVAYGHGPVRQKQLKVKVNGKVAKE